jgi:hypothetical protein
VGVHSLDIEIQCFLSDGYEYVRAHPEVIDEIFENWNKPHIVRRLQNAQGHAPTKVIKKWLKTTNIPVVMGFGQFAIKLPCVSVHLAASQEKAGEATYLGDSGGINSYAPTKEQALVVNDFIPASYNQGTGKLTVNPYTTDISAVRVGMILVDFKNEEYLVELVADNYLVLNTTGDPVDIRKVYIKSADANVRKKSGITRFNENVDIGFHANEEPQVVLWLYYIASWLFLRFKPVLEERGVQVHTWSASDFDRESKFIGEQIFSRWMRFQGDCTVEWTEDPLVTGQSFELDVLAARKDDTTQDVEVSDDGDST